MYHQLTSERIRQRRNRHVRAAALVAAIVVVLAVVFGVARQSMREQAAASVRDAVIQSAKQCCAVEGSYPADVSYLENNYGLRINHDDYVVTYESFASNVMPSVVVVPR